MQKILCLMGPTASGKTDLSLALAEHLPIEIINVDSAQIYKGMDIGSGKPDISLRAKIPHHIIDFLDPAIAYSAAKFCDDALIAIKEIHQRDHIPVLVGGSMLYFKALQQGLSTLPSSDPAIRSALDSILKEQGVNALYHQLQIVDPVTSERLSPTDPQRIQRALEIYQLTGKPLSTWLAESEKNPPPFHFINVALIPIETPRAVLHDRIALRFEKMLVDGFINEVEILAKRGDLHADLPSIRSVGYRQVWEYLQNQSDFATMKQKAIAATRQLAKRQLTWLRSWPDLITVDFLDPKIKERVTPLLLNELS